MSLLDLFTSGEHKHAKTYFAALVKLAFADGILEKEELNFLKKMSVKLGIEDDEFTKILKNPDKYPLDPPMDYNDRIEQLYNFTGMIYASHEIKPEEEAVIEKLAVNLGFPVKNARAITHKAVELLNHKTKFDDFSREIKEVNML